MPGSLVFSLAERARIRYHLGYPSLQAFTGFRLVFIPVSQRLFLVEKSMDNLLDEAVPLVREHGARLDAINIQLDEARERLQAAILGDITLRPDEPEALRREYYMWARSLADILGCPLNGYSEKFNSGMGMAPVNTPVVQ